MDIQLLKEFVAYCPKTGIFTRKKSAGNTAAGSVIGNIDAKGYLKAFVLGEYVKLHRLAWFYTYEVWPTRQIDHIRYFCYCRRSPPSVHFL